MSLYFALRSYRDDGEHYGGQIGSEATPQAFLEALWSVTAELWRVLKPTGVVFVNLGDKRSGSGGHNNSGISSKSTLRGNGHVGGVGKAGPQKIKATLRDAPDRYNQAAFGRAKSKMLLPHRYAEGCEDGLADPCVKNHEHVGRHPAYTEGEQCRGVGWIVRQDIVWSKPNGLPESVTDRPRDSHEMWFMLTKEGRYYSAVDEVREAHAESSHARAAYPDEHDRAPIPGLGDRWKAAKVALNPLGKLPGSVWAIPSEPLRVPDWARERLDLPDHFAAFPQEWPRRLILGWSPPGVCVECGEGRRPVVEKELRPIHTQTNGHSGKHLPDDPRAHQRIESDPIHGATRNVGATEVTITGYACACASPTAPTTPAVVLDPFVGTGTVPMVARALGRYGVGTDLSADYLRLARWRTFESGHAAKAINRTNGERQGALL